MSSKTIFSLLLLAAFGDCIHGLVTHPMFSEEELTFFASLKLCDRFGGACGSECPFRYITHKWGVPLCYDSVSSDMHCCVGPEESNEPTTAASPVAAPDITTSPKPNTLPEPEYKICGKIEESNNRQKRIVGGHVANATAWPWLVAFRSLLGSHACAGAVVAQQWIVTAAHCFKHVSNPSLWRVRVGDYHLLMQEDNEQELHIEKIILHPGYTSRLKNKSANQTLHAKYVHDIALVRLSEDAKVTPLCLPLTDDFGNSLHSEDSLEQEWEETSNDIEPSAHAGTSMGSADETQLFNEIPNMGLERRADIDHSVHVDESWTPATSGRCLVAGWGQTLDPTKSDHVLHEVSGEIIGSEECSHLWREQLENDMLCFGDGTYGPCAGDSGGPLSCERDGKFFLRGVVSWGTEECNVSGYPSVFTNIKTYLPWIREQMSQYD